MKIINVETSKEFEKKVINCLNFLEKKGKIPKELVFGLGTNLDYAGCYSGGKYIFLCEDKFKGIGVKECCACLLNIIFHEVYHYLYDDNELKAEEYARKNTDIYFKFKGEK